MIRPWLAAVLSAWVMGGCAGDELQITDVRLLLSRADLAVGYFTITNGTGQEQVLVEANSADFEAVELHETTMTDGVMRMRRRDRIAIPTGEAATFASGGLHLMLFGPQVEPGEPATLRLTFASGRQIMLSAPLSRR